MSEEINSKALQRLLADLTSAHAENLVSVTLYGSTAVEDQLDANAHHNVLVVLRKMALEDMRRSVAPLKTWTKSGQPMPVLFSLDELQRAADVFPIEFLQMQKARRVLHGSDPLQLVETSDAKLRHQLEYELRTRVLQLRRLYFSAGQSPEKLLALMVDSLSSFAALFRAALVLLGKEAPVGKREAIQATANAMDLKVAPFDRILEFSGAARPKLSETEANELFGNYIAQLDRLVDAVDQIQKE